MGVVSKEEVFEQGKVLTPIDNALRGETLHLLLASIKDALKKEQRKGYLVKPRNAELVEKAREEYNKAVVQAQNRVYGLMEALTPHLITPNLEAVEKSFEVKGYCLNLEDRVHEGEEVTRTRSGRQGVIVQGRIPLEDFLQELLSRNPEEELLPVLLHSLDYDHGHQPMIEPALARYAYSYTGKGRKKPLALEVQGRVKLRDSFASKITDKLLGVNHDPSKHENIYDFTAVRIITPGRKQCFDVLEELKRLEGYHLVQGMEKDRINHPKENGYQDLKAVLAHQSGEGFLLTEVQIMSKRMLDKAEHHPKLRHDHYQLRKMRERVKRWDEWSRVKGYVSLLLGAKDYF